MQLGTFFWSSRYHDCKAEKLSESVISTKADDERQQNNNIKIKGCHAINEDSSVGVAVVHGGEGAVALLAGSIPHLELDLSLIDRQHLGQERGTNNEYKIPNLSQGKKREATNPIVASVPSRKVSRQNLKVIEVLPTPLLPRNTTLKLFFAAVLRPRALFQLISAFCFAA